ncbi:hypothetical protein EYF80_066817 [Liparis tanakae]|uniref:Uncharacterized protein n=1 Tax=Liparis tanakae TaxID=230148 RepID=A0A4Z2E2D8_9TELE|nr:hypothetical protein EYF80_066817 [Liparis tanakae]
MKLMPTPSKLCDELEQRNQSNLTGGLGTNHMPAGPPLPVTHSCPPTTSRHFRPHKMLCRFLIVSSFEKRKAPDARPFLSALGRSEVVGSGSSRSVFGKSKEARHGIYSKIIAHTHTHTHTHTCSRTNLAKHMCP